MIDDPGSPWGEHDHPGDQEARWPTQRRVVRLRRPPVLSIAAQRFVPEGGVLDEVDRRWDAICAANPVAYDGTCYHVLGVHRNGYGGATLHVMECAYRFHAVQSEAFDVGMRGLGVKGIVERNGKLLLGRRAPHVSFYGGQWELAPGGAVEPGEEPRLTIEKELEEETTMQALRPPSAIALLYDPWVRTWEIIHQFHGLEGEPMVTDEYPEIGWFDPGEVESWGEGELTPLSRRLLPMARATIRMSSGR